MPVLRQWSSNIAVQITNTHFYNFHTVSLSQPVHAKNSLNSILHAPWRESPQGLGDQGMLMKAIQPLPSTMPILTDLNAYLFNESLLYGSDSIELHGF